MGSMALDPHKLTSADYDVDAKNYRVEDDLTKDVIKALKVAGGCIVRNLFGQSTVYKISKDFEPYLKAKQNSADYFWPTETTLLNGLVSKSDTFAREIVGNKTFQDAAEELLTRPYKGFWVGQRLVQPVSKPQMNNTCAFRIAPGAKDQGFHRDDNVHHGWNGPAETYDADRDTGVAIFMALTPTTKANGATRFIPGSHLWDYTRPPPEDNESSVYIELSPGDAFFMLHSTLHGGSANVTTDEYRFICMATATTGLLRQEENQYLANDIEKVKKLPLHLQRFLGWGISDPWKGYVELQDPILQLNPDEKSLWNTEY